jgi:hypothetical protein
MLGCSASISLISFIATSLSGFPVLMILRIAGLRVALASFPSCCSAAGHFLAHSQM